MKFIVLSCCLFSFFAVQTLAQKNTLTVIDSGQDCSIRGMSITTSSVIWLSGSNGHVARSTDTGKTWKWSIVKGYEKTDFRDIHAFDSNTAIVMGIGNPAYILKTKDGGQSWKIVFTKELNGIFLDAMDFKNKQEGICIGDPVDDGSGKTKFFVIRTKDGGETWQAERPQKLQKNREGEAVFSASGTNIALLNNKEFDYAFISGGHVSKFYLIGRDGKANRIHPIPIINGTESSGAFSMATDRNNKFYFVGGDYTTPDIATSIYAWDILNAAPWKAGGTQPSGYRSCIRIIEGESLVSCGTNGVDLSDDAKNWHRISNQGFNVCMISPDRKHIFFAGAKGKIAVMNR
jgi:photosystem II stability/assembly factor-like uncharacterized protein